MPSTRSVAAEGTKSFSTSFSRLTPNETDRILIGKSILPFFVAPPATRNHGALTRPTPGSSLSPPEKRHQT